MIKILSTDQIRKLDAYTIEHEPVPSIELMERACKAFVNWLVQHVDASKKIGIVCGTGNNGGDGLGIARMLDGWGYAVNVWVVRGGMPETPDFKQNLERIRGKLDVYEITTPEDQGLFAGCDVLIDAIFGSGLSRPPEGVYAQAIRCMNKANAMRVAVDIPSGLPADKPSSGDVLRAQYTISFQLPKLVFLLPQSHAYTGEIVIADIGLSRTFITASDTDHFQITARDVRKIIKPRSKYDHKGVYGHALIVAGSKGKIGAAVLASRAALRSGVGLLTTHVAGCGYAVVQTAVPEAMTSVDTDENRVTGFPALENFSTIGIGPGLGQDAATTKALETLLKNFRKPIVMDADALNILASNPGLLEIVPENSILTPHPKEFERLVGKWGDDFERLEKQKELALRLQSVIVLKGANSSIATPEKAVFFNSTGNPGMATGGTGDVLTGILAGLLAQNYLPVEAAVAGVYLHGYAGDLAAQEKGMTGLIASDVVEFLPQAFLRAASKK